MIRAKNGNEYHYRSIRWGGKVRTIYFGCGPAALAIVAMWSLDREADRRRRELQREWWRVEDERQRPVIEWSRRVDEAVRTALEGAGYRRHKRGEWRRRKAMTTTTTNPIQPAPAATTAPAKATPAPLTPELRAVERRWLDGAGDITRAEAGALLDARPEMVEASAASPSGQLLVALLKPLDGDKVRHELTRRKFFRVRRDLAGPDPTPAESLLAERAAVCWLDLQITDLGRIRLEDKATPSQVIQLMKRVDAAHRRFLSSVKALAVVRKLAVPDLKVNFDGRSVHFNSPAQPAGSPAPAIDVTP